MAYHPLPLPYAFDALEPHISAATLHEHYDRHHANYAKQAETLAAESNLVGLSLQDLVHESHARDLTTLFNHAAQAWNHDFFWHCLSGTRDVAMPKPLEQALTRHFQSTERFLLLFAEKAAAHFGSGWAWLVSSPDGLDIVTTENGDTPVTSGLAPLFAIDVWEHAYYIDRRHDRKAYIDAVLHHLADWRFAAKMHAFYEGKTDIKALHAEGQRMQRLTWPRLMKMPT